MPKLPPSSQDEAAQQAANAAAIIDEYSRPFRDYEKVAKTAVEQLIGAWKDEIKNTDERRAQRYLDIDIENAKDGGMIDKDSVYTPVMLVNSNISKQVAVKMQFLTKTSRLIIASCNEDSAIDGSPVEKAFTTAARYNGWELPMGKLIDGCETHAWDTVEVLFDEGMPGNFVVEHNGHDRLLFSTDSKDIQSNDFIVKLVDITRRDLVGLVKKKNFSAIQASKILEGPKDDKLTGGAQIPRGSEVEKFGNITIEKVFFKDEDGYVYVGWSQSKLCDDWLRPPQRLFLGQIELNPEFNQADPESSQYIQLFERSYPIEPLIFSLSEDACLMRLKGRVALDQPKAEAATSLLTSALTSYRRASNLYWCPDTDGNDGTQLDEAQTDITLAPNRLFNKKVKQLQLTPAPAEIFNAVYMIIGQSQQESGDTNYAVMSNKSTRKTAAEVKLADKDSSLLSGVGTTLLSISMRNIYTRCFQIWRSRAIAGLIKTNETVAHLLHSYTWTIKPAGDTDVVERNEKIQTMQSAWTVYQNTGAKNVFLKTLTSLLFPDEAGQFIRALEDNEVQVKLLASLMVIIQGIVMDPETQTIRPEYKSEESRLTQLLAQCAQVVQQAQQQGTGAPGGEPQQQLEMGDNNATTDDTNTAPEGDTAGIP